MHVIQVQDFAPLKTHQFVLSLVLLIRVIQVQSFAPLGTHRFLQTLVGCTLSRFRVCLPGNTLSFFFGHWYNTGMQVQDFLCPVT